MSRCSPPFCRTYPPSNLISINALLVHAEAHIPGQRHVWRKSPNKPFSLAQKVPLAVKVEPEFELLQQEDEMFSTKFLMASCVTFLLIGAAPASAQQEPGGSMMPGDQEQRQHRREMMEQRRQQVQQRDDDQDSGQSDRYYGRGMMGPGYGPGWMHPGRRYGWRQEPGPGFPMMGQGMMGPGMMRMMLVLMDSDGDGSLSLQEFQAGHERIFRALDANRDGRVTLEEFQAFMSARPAQPQ